VDQFRKRSKASSSGPWATDYDAMALKTAIRRLSTWLPLSVEMAGAAAADEQIIVDSSSIDIIEQPALPEPEPTSGAPAEEVNPETGEKREPTAAEVAEANGSAQGTLLDGKT
jgi:recombination protein RecT